jgi:hypothetical protein
MNHVSRVCRRTPTIVLPLLFVLFLYGSMSEASAGDRGRVGCREAILLSDADSDQFLSRYPEYITYLQYMSEGGLQPGEAWGQDVVFRELPTPLRDNFEAFAGSNGQINITGASPECSEQPLSVFLDSFCSQTRQSIDNSRRVKSIPWTPWTGDVKDLSFELHSISSGSPGLGDKSTFRNSEPNLRGGQSMGPNQHQKQGFAGGETCIAIPRHLTVSLPREA